MVMLTVSAADIDMATPIITLNTLTVDFRLALRNILRQRRRSAIAIAAIGFGVIAMMLSAGYIEWIFWANREAATGTATRPHPGNQARLSRSGQADPMRLPAAGQLARLSALCNTPRRYVGRAASDLQRPDQPWRQHAVLHRRWVLIRSRTRRRAI